MDFAKTTAIKITVLHFQKANFCIFSVILRTQKFLFMVVFMISIFNLILKWFLRKIFFQKIYIIGVILFFSNGKKFVNKKFIYHEITYIL